MAQSFRDSFEQCIAQLIKSREDAVRNNVVKDITLVFEAAKRELPPLEYLAFYEWCKKTIYTFVQNGADFNERIAGLEALNAIIDFRGDEGTARILQINNVLKRVFTGNDKNAMCVAARVLGHLVEPGGTNEAEIVESEVKTSLEWLQSGGSENKRFAAVLILLELARSSRTHTHEFVQRILDAIWTALRDSKVLVRQAAAATVSECLFILIERDPTQRQGRLSSLYDEVNRGFQIGTVEAIHGSLLVLKDLVSRGGMYIHGQRYKDSCERALSYKDHRDIYVRQAVIALIPVMAGYAPTDFFNLYLHRAITHLQNLMKAPKMEERNSAFLAVGSVALAMKSQIAPYLDHILLLIRDALGSKTKGKQTDADPVFQCISMISRAVGQTLSKYMEALMDPIFACGLSVDLTQALVDMTHNIPPIKETIQDRLLDMLCRVLCGRPFQDPGHPAHGNRAPIIYTQAERDRKDPHSGEAKEKEIVLALDTLGSFDFSGKSLNELVRDVAIKYVEDDSPQIRKAAALTSCQLFLHDPIVRQTSIRSIQVVGDVVQKLLSVAVADPDVAIRHTVLNALDARFDVHLAKAENVRTLFLCVNDEVFAIREAAMTIVGRLSAVNPAYVFPSLRKVLVQLLTELEQSNVASNKEESARLISRLVRSSSQLIKPYVDSMFKVLLPKTMDSNSQVASTTLIAIGDLTSVGQGDMLQYVPQIMPIIIENLEQQHSTQRRAAALSSLEKLATNSGYVIQPYIQYPMLLSVLIHMVRNEPANHPDSLREKTIRLMGIIGALDPYKHQEMDRNIEANADNGNRDVQIMIDNKDSDGKPLGARDDYFAVVAIDTLMRIIKDTNLASIHKHVVDAVMSIYKTMGLACLRFLKQVVTGILSIIDDAAPDTRKHYFSSLGVLISIVRVHIRPFLKKIMLAVQIHWHESVTTMIGLIEQISKVLEGEFKLHLASVLPLMLEILEQDQAPGRERVLQALIKFKSSAEDYMHLIIPAIVRVFSRNYQPTTFAKSAIESIGKISRQVNISEFASQIIQPLARILAGSDPTLKQVSLDALCALIFQMGTEFLNFVPTINKALAAHKFPHHNYTLIVSKLQKGEPLPQDLSPEERYTHDEDDQGPGEASSKKLAVNQLHLKNAWESTSKHTKDDWTEWMRRLSVELLRESPQQALRACGPLTSVYRPIAIELFNAAFASCWTELYEQYQQELAQALERALTSPTIPSEISQQLLKLAEFMEHDDKALPIDIRLLSMYAHKSHAFAKALYYKETEYKAEESADAIEALIVINNHLQQKDAAFGMLRRAQGQNSVHVKESWFESLARWEDALKGYQKREREEPGSFELAKGKMRCLHALGNWDVLSSLAQEKWLTASSDNRKSIAPLAAAAAWGMGQWELMDTYLSYMVPKSPDHSFFGAIIRVHRNQFTEAAQYISQARKGLEEELRALLGESYARAEHLVVRVQSLAELEEVIAYKRANRDIAKRERILATWTERLKGCSRSVDSWQRMLKVRALVVTPNEMEELYIKFASICRKGDRRVLAEQSLNALIDSHGNLLSSEAQPRISAAPYQVQYAIYKYMYASGHKQQALQKLQIITANLRDAFEQQSQILANQTQNAGVPLNAMDGLSLTNGRRAANAARGGKMPTAKDQQMLLDWRTLLSRCYLKQGEWTANALDGDWLNDDVQEVLQSYKAATRYKSSWFKAWHEWALANFEVVTSMTAHTDRASAHMTLETINAYVVPAIHGFFKSIELSHSSSIQDTLRLLTLWFAHGQYQEVTSAVTQGMNTVDINTWLDVVPQLIARINQPNARIRTSIHSLLCEMGRQHPQALIYPLTVAANSKDRDRARAADQVMQSMRQHSAQLCEQAAMVSDELIRMAVLWFEQGMATVDDVFADHTDARPDIRGRMHRLFELHDKYFGQSPSTMHEMAFIQTYGALLHEAKEALDDIIHTGELDGNPERRRICDIYGLLYKRWLVYMKLETLLDLQHVSPRLWQASNMSLAVPGTYVAGSGKPIVRIQSFQPNVQVISTKKRPRKMVVVGSDGEKYEFLLKGGEDIRQDERVMQLFALVNTLLRKDPAGLERRLHIQGYAAIPLGGETGLLSWVPNCDTIHELIKEYRVARSILLNIEYRIMRQMFTGDFYDHLPLLQKVEVFSYALDNTTGFDLYRILWLKSTSSETWLERRTTYTRSLAVMSIVGYFLGLGDRHPSNLMIQRKTGKVVHIDFGDCFEVGMKRAKYPELVQFRLTRMLTLAMEVSNIEGSFRTTCEVVLRICREHQQSLVAVLEAFIHDPLLTWRLDQDSVNVPSAAAWQFTNKDDAAITLAMEVGSLPMGRSRAGTSVMGLGGGARSPQDTQSKNARSKALVVLERVKVKLSGREFRNNEEHVEALLNEATNLENLCQLYSGWCAFW